MTKRSAVALMNQLGVRCDDAFLFITKVGTGYVASLKARGNWDILLTLFLGLIDEVLGKLNAQRNREAVEIICLHLLKYLTDETPASKPPENISDKQRRHRTKNNQQILDAIEEALK